MLFDEIGSVYFVWKIGYIYILALEMAIPRERALCQLSVHFRFTSAVLTAVGLSARQHGPSTRVVRTDFNKQVISNNSKK